MASGAVPPGFEDTLVTRVSEPTAIAFTPDQRLLLTTRTGKLRVYQDGALVATPALDIGDKVCFNLERGLLGLTVDPAFETNHHIYLYYTYNKFGACDDSTKTPVNRVSRFTLSDANVADRTSELVLIDNIPSPQGQHNAGDLHFGKDNYLYISVGDGNCDYAKDSGCGPFNNATRDPHVLLGKILRITPGGGVPPTNPYLGPDSARCNLTGRTTAGKKCRETYASGLRNPFRFAVDPNAAGTRFFVNDVGHITWEEINLGYPGADYGWNVREGHCARASTTDCGPPPAGMTNPIYDYPHNTDCTAITGGAFVPNSTWPAQYNGAYLFADYACGKIFVLRPEAGGYSTSEFASGLGTPIVLAFGPQGNTQALYYTTFNQGGEIRRVAFTGALNRTPIARASANPRDGDLPLTVTFDAAGSSDPDGDALTYEWDFGDGSPRATGARASHRYEQAGTYMATLRVSDNRGATGTARLRIDAGNNPPTPTIELPGVSTRFRVGQTIRLQGSATDPEDGTLPDDALSWTVLLRHNAHTHPFLGPVSGDGVPFSAPAPEDLSSAATTDLRITLTATDSRGLRRSIVRTLRPKTVNVTLASQPAGLRLEADGFPITTPSTVVSWAGYTFRVRAAAQVDDSGQPWTFSSWSDGGAAAHSITTPLSDATYTSRFRPRYPNVLFIVTDDQRPTETLDVMPKTQQLFGALGTYFPSAFATTPLCCPSRASIFTGRYAHNHGVEDNEQGSLLDHNATLQRRLQSAGYTTALFGKLLNGWDLAQSPPYFDRWSVMDGGTYTNFPVNEQGRERTITDQYATTYLSDKATEFIRETESDDQRPWLLYVTPTAPHGPFVPEEKYRNASIPPFEPNPAFFEPDLSDKPPYVRQARNDPAEARRRRNAQLRMLMSVDDLVANVFDALRTGEEADNTLAFFISDNGYMWGEHGLLEKRHPYTHSVQIPFYMRLPGTVRAGATDPRLVANIDLAPTVLDAAGLAPNQAMDGTSLLRPGSRDRLLLERLTDIGPFPTWGSIRTSTYQYTEYYRDSQLPVGVEPDFREYYDLVADPWKLTNYLGDSDTDNDPPPQIIAALHAQLAADLTCAGRGTVPNRSPCP